MVLLENASVETVLKITLDTLENLIKLANMLNNYKQYIYLFILSFESFCILTKLTFLQATMPQFLHTDRLDQARPSPWEEHTHQLKKMILQSELFHELSEGSLRKERRRPTVSSVSEYLTWRLVDMFTF